MGDFNFTKSIFSLAKALKRALDFREIIAKTLGLTFAMCLIALQTRAQQIDMESTCKNIAESYLIYDDQQDGTPLRLCQNRNNPSVWWEICSGVHSCEYFYLQNRTLGRSLSGEASQICHALIYNYCNQKCASIRCEDFEFDFGTLLHEVGFNWSLLPPACQEKKNLCTRDSNSNATQAGSIPELEEQTRRCESTSQDISSICTRTPQDMGSTLAYLADQTSRAIQQGGVSACSATARNASAVQAALGAAKTQCTSSYSQCSQECRNARQILEETRRNPNLNPQISQELDSYSQRIRSAEQKCNQAQTHLESINQNLQQVTQAMQNSQQCAAELAASMGYQELPFAACQQNPNQKGCEWFRSIGANLDCSRPENSGNMLCFCQKFPGDSRCGGLNSGSSQGLGLKVPQASLGAGEPQGGSASSSGLGNFSESTGFGGGESPNFLPNQASSQAQGSSANGAGGAGLYQGGLTPHSSTPIEKTPQGPKKKLNVLLYQAKQFGQSLAEGLKRLLSSDPKSPKDGNLSDFSLSSQTGNSARNPDLRAFLPPSDSLLVGRSYSSVTGPDGLTGPFSDNFKKINNRYVAVQATLRN